MFTPEAIATRRKSNLKLLNANRELVLCTECLFGHHLNCGRGECPCVCGDADEPSFGQAVSIKAA
jgi:hypothetical protein